MKISRDELYRRVWETPMTKLAKEFDISDVGLSKACRKSGIPTPPAGYWAKVRHGKGGAKPPLPESSETELVLDAARYRSAARTERDADGAVTAVPVVQIQAEGDNLAAVAAATFAVLRNAKPDKGGFVQSGSSNVFACVLSPQAVARAARILDAIERAMPDLGIALVRDRDNKCIVVESEGERLTFALAEVYRRTEHVKVDPKYTWRSERVFTYEFTGALKLSLHADFSGRKTWSDGVRGRVEDKLGHFLAGIVEAARGVRALRESREEQKRRWEEAARRSQLAAEQARRLKAFSDNFVAEAEAWERFRQAEAYLQLLQQHAPSGAQASEASSEWLRQAAVAVMKLDPARKRLERLHTAYESPEWLAPFGEVIVPTRLGG